MPSSRPPPGGQSRISTGSFHRWVLDALVVFNVVAQAILVAVLVLGRRGASVAPLAGGAAVAMFLLAYFYGRWLLPLLRPGQILALILLKELAVGLVVGLIAGLVALIRWIF